MEFYFDKDYVDRLRKGDPPTEQHFVAYFDEFLRAKLRSRTISADNVENLRQETFIRVIATIRREGGVHQPGRLGPLVNSVCNKVLLEYLSAKSHPTEDTFARIHDLNSDLDLGRVTRQSEGQLACILEGMPKRDRDILCAIFLEEKDKDAVCQEMGIDREYLRVLIHHAKLAFKLAYEDQLIPDTEQRGPASTTTPPGATLYSIAEFICSKKTLEDIVMPLLADMQFEHNEAFSSGQKSEAAWIRVRGCWSLFKALGINRTLRMFVRLFLRLSSR